MLENLEECPKPWIFWTYLKNVQKPECLSCTENFDKITSNLLIYGSPTLHCSRTACTFI